MAPAPQQNTWATQLEAGKNRSARASDIDQETEEQNTKPPGKTRNAASIMTMKATAEFVKILLQWTIETFGLTLIPLFFYTLVRDLVPAFGEFMADPGDVIFMLPPEELEKIPDWLKSWPRLLIRVGLIYPLGGGATFLVVIVMAVFIAILKSAFDSLGPLPGVLNFFG